MKFPALLFAFFFTVSCSSPSENSRGDDQTPSAVSKAMSLNDKISNFNIYYPKSGMKDSLVIGLEKAANVLSKMDETPVFVVGTNSGSEEEVYLYTIFSGNSPYQAGQGLEEIVEQNRQYIDSARTYPISSVRGKVKF